MPSQGVLRYIMILNRFCQSSRIFEFFLVISIRFSIPCIEISNGGKSHGKHIQSRIYEAGDRA